MLLIQALSEVIHEEEKSIKELEHLVNDSKYPNLVSNSLNASRCSAMSYCFSSLRNRGPEEFYQIITKAQEEA